VARRDRGKAAARRDASVDRARQRTGRPHQDASRERHGRLAALVPSAARVLVDTPQGPRSVDPVATALAFSRGLLCLQGAGSDQARERASLVHRALIATPPITVPSGLTLAEALQIPAGALPQAAHDGLLTVARHLTEAGERHDAAEVDLYTRVAPLGRDRHPHADEVDLVCAAVLPEEVAADEGRPRLVLTTDDGWLEVWPPAAMQAVSLGVLTGDVADTVGTALYAWLTGPRAAAIAAEGPDALPRLFAGADIAALIDAAAQRAGSDHPALAGPVLLQMLAPPPP